MSIADDNPVYFVSGADLDAVGEKIGISRRVESDSHYRMRLHFALKRRERQEQEQEQQRG